MKLDPWGICEGRLSIQSLPGWVDHSLLQYINVELEKIGPWLSTQRSRRVTFGISNSTAAHCTCYQTSERDYLCPVPVGLLIRLDYICRVLALYRLEPHIHAIDGYFYGFIVPNMDSARAALPLPWPIAEIVDTSTREADFWKRLEEIDSNLPIDQDTKVRSQIFDYVKYAVLFFCMHEAAHIFRLHNEIIPLAPTEDEGRKWAEVDADVTAGRYLNLYSQELDLKWGEGHTTGRDISEKCFNYSYGISLILGSFDIESYPYANFSKSEYLQPTARLMITLSEALHGWVVTAGPDVAKVCCYEPSAEGCCAYLSQMDSYWIKSGPSKFHRPTALYFPHIFGRSEHFGGLQFMAPSDDVPTLSSMYKEAAVTRDAFEKVFSERVGYGDGVRTNAGHLVFKRNPA